MKVAEWKRLGSTADQKFSHLTSQRTANAEQTRIMSEKRPWPREKSNF